MEIGGSITPSIIKGNGSSLQLLPSFLDQYPWLYFFSLSILYTFISLLVSIVGSSNYIFLFSYLFAEIFG